MQESLGNGSSEGLIAKAKPEGRKRSKEKPKNLKCFLCHKEGHFKKDYPKRKLKKKDKNGDAVVAEDGGYKYARKCIATYNKENGK